MQELLRAYAVYDIGQYDCAVVSFSIVRNVNIFTMVKCLNVCFF